MPREALLDICIRELNVYFNSAWILLAIHHSGLLFPLTPDAADIRRLQGPGTTRVVELFSTATFQDPAERYSAMMSSQLTHANGPEIHCPYATCCRHGEPRLQLQAVRSYT